MNAFKFVLPVTYLYSFISCAIKNNIALNSNGHNSLYTSACLLRNGFLKGDC